MSHFNVKECSVLYVDSIEVVLLGLNINEYLSNIFYLINSFSNHLLN